MQTKNNTLALRLKQLRKIQGLSQTVFGKAIGLSQQAVVGIETGQRETTVSRLVDIANYFNTTLDYLTGRSACPFTSEYLEGYEDTLINDFILEALGQRPVEDQDFFHFIVHRSLIVDKRGCYLTQDQRRMSFILPERIEILVCLWGMRDASQLIDKIDLEQKWRKIGSDEDLEKYWADLIPLLAESDLTAYLQRDREYKSDEYAGAFVSSWLMAYETLCKYGLDSITFAQNEVETKVELARKKKAEELAAKIEKLRSEAEEELNEEIDKIRKDMRTEKRKKH